MLLPASLVNGFAVRATSPSPAAQLTLELAFAPNAATLALGDVAGAVVIVQVDAQSRARVSVQLGAAATSLAFARDGRQLAAADARGGITLVATADGDIGGIVRHWSQPIRWLEFGPDASALLVATDSWAHALAATPALVPLYSKLVVWPASSPAFIAVSGTSLRFAGVETGGVLASGIVDMAAPAAAADASALVARDWSTALKLVLNDTGEPVPLDP